jgi:hypothetical protein
VKFARRFCVLAAALVYLHLHAPTAIADTGYCDIDCGTSKPCDYACMYGGSFTTCGEFNGGPSSYMCGDFCGDGYCTYGEDSGSCSSDCAASLIGDSDVTVAWPNDGVPWSNSTTNWPADSLAGDCEGNCGPGCQSWSVCGAPTSYWELSVTSSPSVSASNVCRCSDVEDTLECGTMTTWSANGMWVYHGWTADGCANHDWVCQPPVWPSVAVAVIGYVATGGVFNSLFWWIEAVANPVGGCYDASWFLTGGACDNAGPAVWSYTTPIQTSNFAFDHYEQAFPGNCSSRPHCGDGICQEEGCVSGVDGTSPGDGCEEQGGFNSQWCSSDCN